MGLLRIPPDPKAYMAWLSFQAAGRGQNRASAILSWMAL